MMTFHNLPTANIITGDYQAEKAKERVARALLELVTTHPTAPISQRDIALLAGMDWAVVHSALKSLNDIGAIKIDRNRMILNKNELARVLDSYALS
jgi:DNA-binding GntR family transcriptional regulator